MQICTAERVYNRCRGCITTCCAVLGGGTDRREGGPFAPRAVPHLHRQHLQVPQIFTVMVNGQDRYVTKNNSYGACIPKVRSKSPAPVRSCGPHGLEEVRYTSPLEGTFRLSPLEGYSVVSTPLSRSLSPAGAAAEAHECRSVLTPPPLSTTACNLQGRVRA